MVFPGVNLPDGTAHTGAVVSDDDEQIFGGEAKLLGNYSPKFLTASPARAI